MKNIKQFWTGHIESAISSIVQDLPALIHDSPYMLITSIDSSRDLHTLTTIAQLITDCETGEFIENSLVVKGNEFYELPGIHELFHGFDEVWLFPAHPLSALPAEVWLTGPLDISNEIPNGMIHWMKQTDCMLGLGDGIGLNYITPELNIGRTLEEYGKMHQ